MDNYPALPGLQLCQCCVPLVISLRIFLSNLPAAISCLLVTNQNGGQNLLPNLTLCSKTVYLGSLGLSSKRVPPGLKRMSSFLFCQGCVRVYNLFYASLWPHPMYPSLLLLSLWMPVRQMSLDKTRWTFILFLFRCGLRKSSSQLAE